jgi:hypothetical protein
MAIPFVGKRFSVAEFKAHLQGISFTSSFRPEFVTLHHTASPSLAQRPQGFSDQHLQNLRHYYQEQLGWNGAPHLFIDDQAKPIIVFQRLDRRGVHAVSFNRNAWGIEMLGNFDSENPEAGRGGKVVEHSIDALAEMCRKLGVGATTIRFHRDDPRTNKSCPGRRIHKVDIEARVAAKLGTALPPEVIETPELQEWTVVLPDGTPHVPVHTHAGRPLVRIKTFGDLLRPGGSFRLSADKLHVVWTLAGGNLREVPVREIDEAGASWGYLRDLADAAGMILRVQGKLIEVVNP